MYLYFWFSVSNCFIVLYQCYYILYSIPWETYTKKRRTVLMLMFLSSMKPSVDNAVSLSPEFVWHRFHINHPYWSTTGTTERPRQTPWANPWSSYIWRFRKILNVDYACVGTYFVHCGQVVLFMPYTIPWVQILASLTFSSL